MLLPYTTLTYYGPDAAAMSLEDGIGVGELLQANPHQQKRISLSVQGLGDAPVFRPYRGYAAAFTADGNSFILAAPKRTCRFSLVVDVGAVPSAFDIAQAIWNSLKVSYNAPGTMGNAVNSAGTASDPTEAIMTDPRMLTVPKFLGLK